MSEKEKRQEGRLFDLFTFLITSARGSLEEGVFTASLRLVDAAGRLPDLADKETQSKEDNFMKEMQIRIKEGMTSDYLSSEERYISFLDSLLEKVAMEVRKRNNL